MYLVLIKNIFDETTSWIKCDTLEIAKSTLKWIVRKEDKRAIIVKAEAI